MSRGFLGTVFLLGGLALVPISIRAGGEQPPKLAVSEACAQSGTCCYEPQSICIANGEPQFNMRSGNGRPCKPPNPGG